MLVMLPLKGGMSYIASCECCARDDLAGKAVTSTRAPKYCRWMVSGAKVWQSQVVRDVDKTLIR